MARTAPIIVTALAAIAFAALPVSPRTALADATPSPKPSRAAAAKPQHVHAPLGPRRGYGEQPRSGFALYTRPYRVYHSLGYESGNDIGFRSIDFNAPELHGRAPRVTPRSAGYWPPACQPRPVPGPDGAPWVNPFDFDCW